MDSQFWNDERAFLIDVLLPALFAAALRTAKGALQALGLDVNSEFVQAQVNQAVIDWAKQYGFELVTRLNQTTQKFLQNAVSEWVGSGQPLDALITNLKPVFGPVRAQMIAATEATRAFSEGNFLAWKASGVVDMYAVQTANDSDVDEQCLAEAAGGPYPLHDASHKPPFHINCRCWTYPVVALS